MSNDYSVVKRTLDGVFIGVVSGMGENEGTWDATHSLKDARRFAGELREEDSQHNYVVEDLVGLVDDDYQEPSTCALQMGL